MHFAIRGAAAILSIGLTVGSTVAQSAPLTMTYKDSIGSTRRYIFSQRGWMDSSMARLSTGNVFAGFVHETLVDRDGRRSTHRLQLDDFSVHYLIRGDIHVKQPSDQVVRVPVPVVSEPGRATRITLPEEEAARLPFLAGILPSLLRVDLPLGLPPLAPGPVAPGDSWRVRDAHVLPTVLPDDREVTHRITSDITYRYEGRERRPVGFNAPDSVMAMRIVGTGTVHMQSEGIFNSTIDEVVTVTAHFDPDAGRWLQVRYESRSTMQTRRGDREVTGTMGFTNDYLLVGTRSSS